MAKADINIAQSRGNAVVALLERAQISPLPAFYTLLYNYLAGVKSPEVARAGHVVENSRPGDAAGQLLYDEFVRPYEPGDAQVLILSQMLARLQALDTLLVERCAASQSQTRALAAAQRLEPDALDPTLLRDWVARLRSANEAALETNRRLTEEVEAAGRQLADVREELARLSRDSLIDPLTATANRKGLEGALARALDETRDGETHLSVGVVDVDNFKQINDAYGHQVGDAALKLAARAMLANVRGGDLVGRMGGDEFVIVLPGCSGDDAIARAEVLRRALLDADLSPLLGSDVLGGLTVSIGVASHVAGDSVATLLGRADGLLLKAKSRGRNRVVGEGEAEFKLARAG